MLLDKHVTKHGLICNRVVKFLYTIQFVNYNTVRLVYSALIKLLTPIMTLCYVFRCIFFIHTHIDVCMLIAEMIYTAGMLIKDLDTWTNT